ncbi:hypothetical protein Cma02nite_30390 [Cellulomonas marina]|nr:hypothetical protein Cma02nite_30390 [Cellulomonas marina]
MRSARPSPRPDRWHAVTVDRPLEEVAAALSLSGGTSGRPSGTLGAPLVELGDEVRVDLREATGDHGTELRARAAGQAGGGPALEGRIRAALRRTRSLLETGEVAQPDDLGTTRRTLTSLPLELAIRHGREAGRL